MNPILSVNGNFQSSKNSTGGGGGQIPSKEVVISNKLQNLARDLRHVLKEWGTNKPIPKVLVTVYYNRTIAKSNRVSEMLKTSSSVTSNETIVGARFSDDGNHKHIITHYVEQQTIQESIKKIEIAESVLNKYFNGVANNDNFNPVKDPENPKKKKENDFLKTIPFSSTQINLSKSSFKQIIQDAAYVDRFDIGNISIDGQKDSIISVYDIFEKSDELRSFLRSINIEIPNSRIVSNNLFLRSDQIEILKSRAPYLISMAVVDMQKIPVDDYTSVNKLETSIPIQNPQHEPVVGVIDTLFDSEVYFADWVEYENRIDENIDTKNEDYKHGTAVTSIIVDGPRWNPRLDDGIGNLRVKHFGVATDSGFSSFTIIREIEDIVRENPTIKVWNLSLGTVIGSPENYISAEGATLDRIQYEYDVIFVVAGTNRTLGAPEKIGSPADSLNALVVNSVDSNNQPAKYGRQGPVLSFFVKPDVSYYGGANDEYINVVQKFGLERVQGTSFAAPWLARKLAYLIYYIGLNKELAKALVIDSAIGWTEGTENPLIGRGVVPIRIEKILQGDNDEVKFAISELSEQWLTFNYKYPVPVINKKHPYRAKSTMVYTPKTSRNQGIDYTDTELDISFGRVNAEGKVMSIDNNFQVSDENQYHPKEGEARDDFRKWDNVKHVNEKASSRPKLSYSGSYGLKIVSKERLKNHKDDPIRFGVIITFKEIDGVNRYSWFLQALEARQFVVRPLEIKNQIDIFNNANETIDFD